MNKQKTIEEITETCKLTNEIVKMIVDRKDIKKHRRNIKKIYLTKEGETHQSLK